MSVAVEKKKEVKTLNVCVCGNPNSGKTTIFNTLTGANQKVGNYPGVTVEKKEGSFTYKDTKVKITDLPGTYSLLAYSLEEKIARDYIIKEKPDVVINIVDSTNIERSLYLATQLKELGVKLIIALNMSDVAGKMGLEYNEKLMGELFGARVVKTIGTKKIGVEKLKEEIISYGMQKEISRGPKITYDKNIEEALVTLKEYISSVNLGVNLNNLIPNAVAVKLLEGDGFVLDELAKLNAPEAKILLSSLNDLDKKIEKNTNEDSQTLIAESRYAFIAGVLKQCYVMSEKQKISITEKIDKVLLNRVLGLPIFLVIMYFIFYFSVDLASPLIDKVDGLFSSLGDTVKASMAEGNLRSLIAEGIIGGVGGVLVFVPQILILFLCIAILEATGYMARAAFVIDKLMNKVGLHGKSFIPMLIGFGCTVPAVMAARTMENEKDKKATMIAATFMSCGARFPVYVLLTGALFRKSIATNVIYSVYILGIVVAILTVKILKKFVYKSANPPFVMELPPYRIPTFRNIFRQIIEKLWMYIKKAGTIILAASILFWFLTSFPKLSSSEEAPFNTRISAAEQALQNSLKDVYAKLMGDNAGTNITDYSKALLANAQFKAMHENIDKINTDFDKTVKKESLAEGSASYKALEALKAKKLLELKTGNEALYALAVKYRELVEGKKETVEKIEKEKVALEKKRSYAGRAGSAIAPVFAPMGLDNWRVSVALIAGFAAKEVVVGTMGAVYAIGEEENEESQTLRERLLNDSFFLSRNSIRPDLVVKVGDKYYLKSDKTTPVIQKDGKFYTPNTLVAYTLMVFVLLYIPCMAAFGVYIKEGGIKLALFVVGYTTVAAYLISTIVYQGGRLLGLG